MADLNLESVNNRINDFISGMLFPLAACRLILLIVHLLEQLQDQGREAEVVLRDFIDGHERSRGDDTEKDEPDDYPDDEEII